MRHNKVRDVDDCAVQPLFKGCVRSVDPLLYKQWSQEFQLVSQNSTPLSWLLGAYWFDSDESTRFYNIIPLINPLPRNDYLKTSKETSYALFGQGTLHLNDKWSITGGLRLSHDKDRESEIGTGTADNPELTTAEGQWNHTSWRLGLEYAAAAGVLVICQRVHRVQERRGNHELPAQRRI